MGNSASTLPYTIGKQVATVNDGWVLHDGVHKSDNAVVSVFVAKKPTLSKTPLHRKDPNASSQLLPAKHHYIHCKKLRHPNILKVFATLDTDNPNESTGGGGGPPNSGNATTTTAVSAPVNTNETGDLIIVTEPCITLDEWLDKYNPSLEQIAWGLESIIKALHFLHEKAKYVHGNLHPSSFYVTRAGDIKLWNFSLVTTISPETQTTVPQYFINTENLITPDMYRAPERIEKRWDAIHTGGIHAMDSYGLGVLIEHIFRGDIPAKLTKAVQRLMTPNIRMRPKLYPLLKCPIFDTPYQKVQVQLEELTVTSIEQKIAFWNTVTPLLQSQLIPQLLAVHKLLPLIVHNTIETICTNDTLKSQDMYRREVQATLGPFFYIIETFLAKEECKKYGSVFRLLFLVNDRAIRGSLLQKAPFLEQVLDDDTLNSAVFEPMCSGFSDSSPALRELTLKATLVLVPHLTDPNREKLARYLVRLQSDTESSIRTNTVIFFSKLAPYLSEMTRHKMLLPAFVRAMKDPFTPCRNAALKSTLKAKEFFNPEGIASRVLPAITPQLLDPSPEVRAEAFAAVDELLLVLRQESERLSLLPQPVGNLPQQQQQPGMPVPTSQQQAQSQVPVAPRSLPLPANNETNDAIQKSSSSGSGGGYFSSWIGKSSTTTPAPAAAATTTVPPVQQQQAPPAPTPYQSQPIPTYPTPSPVVPAAVSNYDDDNWSNNDDDLGDDDDDGWGDDDLDDIKPTKPVVGKIGTLNGGSKLSIPPAVAPVSNGSSSFGGFNATNTTANDEDEFFDAFDKPSKPVIIAPPSVRKPGTAGKLVIPKKTTTGTTKLAVSKPVITKIAKAEDNKNIPDGWDDF